MMSENPSAEPANRATSGDTGLLMIGAGILVTGWVLFGLIMGEFTYSAIYMGIAALTLLSILGIGGVKLGNGTLRVFGYFMGAVGVFLLIDNLRYGFPDGVVDNIANIVFYVGAAVMFVGARGLTD